MGPISKEKGRKGRVEEGGKGRGEGRGGRGWEVPKNLDPQSQKPSYAPDLLVYNVLLFAELTLPF